MRGYGVIVLVVFVAVAGFIYIGGTLQVAGKPIFQHLDSALGTTFFMRWYYKFAFMLQRNDTSEENEWTESHHNFEKVLKDAVE